MTAAAEHGATEDSYVKSAVHRWVAPFALCLALGACSTVTDVWEGTTDAVGGLFSSDEDEIAEETEEGYPDLANVPAGVRGDVSDIAAAVCYLASDEARYVSGHSLVVDGGLRAK